MGYESLHIMESLTVQCLQVDNVIPILSQVLLCINIIESSCISHVYYAYILKKLWNKKKYKMNGDVEMAGW